MNTFLNDNQDLKLLIEQRDGALDRMSQIDIQIENLGKQWRALDKESRLLTAEIRERSKDLLIENEIQHEIESKGSERSEDIETETLSEDLER